MSNRPYLQIMYTEFDVNRTKIEGVIALRRGFEIWLEKWLEKAAQKSGAKKAHKNFPPTVSDK